MRASGAADDGGNAGVSTLGGPDEEASGVDEDVSTRSTAHDQPMMPPTYARRTRARPAYWR